MPALESEEISFTCSSGRTLFIVYPHSTVKHMNNLWAHHAEKDLMGIAKSIDPGKPAQSAQADHGRNFSLLADFLCIK